MFRLFQNIVGVTILTMTFVVSSPSRPSLTTGDPNDAACMLKQDMRDLWTDHVVWTRVYIMEAVADQPGAQAAANRLMKNQEDIGKAVATFYGDAAGTQLTTLLKDHISIAVDLVKAARAGDKKLSDALTEGIVKQFPDKFGK